MSTRVNLKDLARATDHLYTVNLLPGCFGDPPNIAGDTLHIVFRSDKCAGEGDAEMWVSQVQPDNEETRAGRGYIPVSQQDTDIPEALYHHIIYWERTSGADNKRHAVIYGRIRIVAGCPV